MSRNTVLLFTAMAMLDLAGIATASAQTPPTQFKDFRTFMQETQTKPAASYVGGPGTKVQDAAALEEMRQHILQMYANMSVVGSFALDDQAFDCVPVMQQPSVRLGGVTQLASPPPLAVAPGGTGTRSSTTAPQVAPGLNFDAHGNLIGCTSGDIPFRRLTLEEMSGFETLGHFFQKGPNGAGQAKPSAPANMPNGTNTPVPCTPSSDGCHSHAYALQYVTNYGVNSVIELWNPALNGGVFSLSQMWVVNDTGVKTQTMESGWLVNPAKYNTSKAVLFIYWTADGYNNTGCYNLECTGFVQVNNTIHLGAGFVNYSSISGSQETLWGMTLQWSLYQGNWWMYYGNTAVGYYPAKQYARSNGHGQSDLSTVSDLIDFGGETVGTHTGGFYYFPQMGNGLFGYQTPLAAQQLNIFYASDRNQHTAWSNLTAGIDSSPNCYASAIVSGTTISFGGPAGKKLHEAC